MFKDKAQPLLYLLISLLYFVRTAIFPGGIITRGIFVVFFSFSIYYFIRVNKEYLPKSLSALNGIFMLIILYGIIFLITGVDSSWKTPAEPFYYFYSFGESILPIYAFYFFSRKEQISDKWFKYTVVLFFITAFLQYSDIRINALYQNSGGEEITNNAGYLFLSLIPMMVFFKDKPAVQYIGLGIITFFVISGMKRGAIFLCAICLLFFILSSLKNNGNKKKVLVVVLLSVLMYFVAHYVEYMLSNSIYFNTRIQSTMDGDSSGRDSIFKMYWDFYINDTNFFTAIFGSGALAGLKYIGMDAHNDWLSILINMGIVGLIAHFLYWKKYYEIWKSSKYYCSSEIVFALELVLLIYFGRTFFSQSLSAMSIAATAVLGYCIGNYDNELDNYGGNPKS